MDFELSDELKEVQKKAREFALSEFTQEMARMFDKEEKYPHEIRKKAFEKGLIDPTNPWAMLITIEELCRADPGLGISATLSLFGEEIIMLFGSDELKEKYLPRVNRGEAIMGLAVTEPGGGSDVAATKTTATKSGDKYVLNGSKMFITNGGIADFIIMLARTSKPEKKRHHGLSVFVVDTKVPGFTANKLEGKLGVRATNTAELILDNLEVPVSNLVGEEGKGFYYIMTFFNISRIYVAAQALGIAQGALDRALEFVDGMVESGAEEYNREYVLFTIADIATRIEAARLLTYKAASYLFQFAPEPKVTSMAKAYAAEAAVYATEKSLELTGLNGLTTDLERFFRDAKIMEIWEGTSEIEKLIITRMLRKEKEVS